MTARRCPWGRGGSRGWWAAWLVVLIGLVVLAPASAARAEGGERIDSYTAALTLDRDGDLTGTDTIRYRFPDGQQRHGLTVRYTGAPGGFEIESVTSPTGAPAEYTVTESGGEAVLRIGDPDATVEGEQTYVISYLARGVVESLPAAGSAPAAEGAAITPIRHAWNVPIAQARVTVAAPARPASVQCRPGARGARQPERCRAAAGTTSTFTVRQLAPKEGVTVALRYPVGTFPGVGENPESPGDVVDVPPIDSSWPADPGGAQPVSDATPGYVAGAAIPAAAAAGMAVLYRRRGRRARYAGVAPGSVGTGEMTRGGRVPVAVRFEPPTDPADPRSRVAPALVGLVTDQRVGTRDLAATVVDLAVRGYLTLEHRDQDWVLTRVDGAGEPQERFEATLYEGLFAHGPSVRLQAHAAGVASTLERAGEQVERAAVGRGWFTTSPRRQRRLFLAGGAALGVLGVGLLGIGALQAVSSVDRWNGLPPLVTAGAGLLVAGMIVAGVGLILPVRTAAGTAVNDQADGFRLYLETAEAGQIRFEEAESVFSRYLPYAIVFGVATRWAQVVEDVAARARADGLDVQAPSWYGGDLAAWTFTAIAVDLVTFSDTTGGVLASALGSGESSFLGGGGSGFFGGGDSGGFFSGGADVSGGGGFGGGSSGGDSGSW